MTLAVVPAALGAAQDGNNPNGNVEPLPVCRLVPVTMIVNFQRNAGRDSWGAVSGSFLSIDVDARAAAARVGVEAVASTLTQGCSSAQSNRPRSCQLVTTGIHYLTPLSLSTTTSRLVSSVQLTTNLLSIL